MEGILEGEMEHHIGYEKHDKSPKQAVNRRNGYSQKRVTSGDDTLDLNIPRDRDAAFEPQIIPKGVRPLEKLYPIVYLDCIHIKTRDNHMPHNKAVYIALAVNMEGKKEILGLWISKNEGAKFWMQVVTELKNRGVEDILIACVDGLKGFEEAINTVFPETIVQLCIVHIVRGSMKFVPWKDKKRVAADLKSIYSAPSEEAALLELEIFKEKWDSKYPTISIIWQRNWAGITPCLAFPQHIKKAIYTTNAIETVNRQIRKIIKNKGVFPNDQAVKKSLYLALQNDQKKWTMPIWNWPLALNQFAILFEGRIKF